MEFRQMRRIRQQLPHAESLSILEKATSGTLALLGDGDYPYAVPISYVYDNNHLFFHSAVSGHKIDAINRYDKASFCVIDMDEIHGDEYTTYFRSVIAFGRIHVITEPAEKLSATQLLGRKFNPNQEEALQKEIEKGFSRMVIIRMDIEHLTGKESIELVKNRNIDR